MAQSRSSSPAANPAANNYAAASVRDTTFGFGADAPRFHQTGASTTLSVHPDRGDSAFSTFVAPSQRPIVKPFDGPKKAATEPLSQMFVGAGGSLTEAYKILRPGTRRRSRATCAPLSAKDLSALAAGSSGKNKGPNGSSVASLAAVAKRSNPTKAHGTGTHDRFKPDTPTAAQMLDPGHHQPAPVPDVQRPLSRQSQQSRAAQSDSRWSSGLAMSSDSTQSLAGSPSAALRSSTPSSKRPKRFGVSSGVRDVTDEVRRENELRDAMLRSCDSVAGGGEVRRGSTTFDDALRLVDEDGNAINQLPGDRSPVRRPSTVPVGVPLGTRSATPQSILRGSSPQLRSSNAIGAGTNTRGISPASRGTSPTGFAATYSSSANIIDRDSLGESVFRSRPETRSAKDAWHMAFAASDGSAGPPNAFALASDSVVARTTFLEYTVSGKGLAVKNSAVDAASWQRRPITYTSPDEEYAKRTFNVRLDPALRVAEPRGKVVKRKRK